MTTAEAKSLLPFVQAIADGKMVEERWWEHGYPCGGDWGRWKPVISIIPPSDHHQLRIVEPEPTQEDMDAEACKEVAKATMGMDGYLHAPAHVHEAFRQGFHAALAWDRKRKEEGR